MFNLLLFKFEANADNNHKLQTHSFGDTSNKAASRPKAYYRQSLNVSAALILATSLLAGCQPPSSAENETAQTEEQLAQEAKTVVKSDSAAAHIKQLQPVYVEQMQRLQRRLQAEYESLQAADMTTSDTDLLLNDTNGTEATEAINTTGAAKTTDANQAKTAISSSEPNLTKTDSTSKANNGVDKAKSTLNDVNTEADLSASTEVGARDLTVLRRISAEPRETTILTEKQIIDSYQRTIDALYQPASKPLNSEETDTLINIAALIPQLFEHPELADRLNAKSPALARLIVQHQIWEQIEARQASYMQEMKIAQQQEFESLMAKFNETIKDYDEQIAKYEQTLKEFEQ